MYLIPQPHSVSMREGFYRLTYTDRITMDSSCSGRAYDAVKLLSGELLESAGLRLTADRRTSAFHRGIHLYQKEELKERLGTEAYTIRIHTEGVEITGGDDAGLLCGVQTLRQIIRQCGTMLPCLVMEDYPELPVRGWFYDVTRGRVPTMAFLKEMADRCSFYKINQMHLYVEHTFLFDGFSEVWRDDTPLTAEDILELDAYCRARNIDLVPSVATFGHLYKLLRTRTYRHLSELEEAEGAEFSFYQRMHHHTLDSTNEESLQLVYRMLDQYIPLFSSELFNINGDETFDLGRGRGKKRAEEIGTHAMYLDWIGKICAYVKAKGKRPMFWGDIIAAHPETIRELPEDVICLTWDYSLAKGDTNVRRLWENGATQYLCPGVQGWSQTINHFDLAYGNIRKMAGLAHQFHAAGLLVTDWGDYGHINHPDFAIVGIAYAAAMGWNSAPVEEASLNEAISRIEYSDRSGLIVSVLRELAKQAVMSWGALVDFEEEYRFRVAGKGMDRFWQDYAPQIAWKLPMIGAFNETIDRCIEEIGGLLPGMDPENRKRMTSYVMMADGQKILNRIMAVLKTRWLEPEAEAAEDPAKVAADFEAWYYEYAKLWRSVSRESELYRLGEAVFWVADYLRAPARPSAGD